MQQINKITARHTLLKLGYRALGKFDLMLLHGNEHDDHYWVFINDKKQIAILIDHPCDNNNCTLLFEVIGIQQLIVPKPQPMPSPDRN